ncbi:caspase domain-containing protein [Hypoxylon sp. FL1857]|nr:caspase domain-containing protein [Hypoxylon sp. FL1857]
MPPTKWAVLIGIEYYDGHRVTTPRFNNKGKEIKFKSLDGCVNDILKVEEYLLNELRIPAQNITKLLAPVPGREHCAELSKESYLEPTYRNIVKELSKVPTKSKEGDLVYIHFSGHGARSTTIFPDLKDGGLKALDESLVPCDITRGGIYLRDLELGALLEDMVSARLVVTLVLDCCHSGGAVRGSDGTREWNIRAVSDVYKSDANTDKPINMAKIAALGRRDSWLTTPQGFVLLAACRNCQEARESLEGSHWYGALTYHLLHGLRGSPLNMPSQQIFDHVLARVHSEHSDQTPHIVGDWDRSFFSRQNRLGPHTLSVQEKYIERQDVRDRYVVLNGNAINGIELLSEYVILPFGFDIGEDSPVLAHVQVRERRKSGSKAFFLQPNTAQWKKIQEGCPAFLHRLPTKKQFKVCFMAPDKNAKAEFKKAWGIHEDKQAWLKLDDGKEGALLIVSITGKHTYEIGHEPGILEATVTHCLESLSATDTKASFPKLMLRLQHIARFKMTESLRNPDSKGRLVDAKIVPSSNSPGSEITKNNGRWQVNSVEGYAVTVTNHSPLDLGIVIVSCDAELSVSRIWPRGDKYELMKSGCRSVRGPFRPVIDSKAVNLSKVARDGTPILQVIKVFAFELGHCDVPPDLDSLHLPGLEGLEKERPSRGEAEIEHSDNLNSLLEHLDKRRGTEYDGESTGYWDVVDLPLQVTIV